MTKKQAVGSQKNKNQKRNNEAQPTHTYDKKLNGPNRPAE
nr:spore protein [Alkalihalobacillus pseudalcaliphilus]